jgi:molecular chaperone DnaK (HSP70)
VLFWPRTVPVNVNPHARPYLRLLGWHGPPNSSPEQQVAFGGREALDGLSAEFGRAPLPQGPDRRAGFDYLAAKLPGNADITIQFTVDTEDDDFIKAARAHFKEKPDEPFALEAHAYLFDAQHRDAKLETIQVVLEGSQALPGFDEGLIGIDLGHSSSSLAWMPPLGDSTGSIQVLDARGRPSSRDDREPTILGKLDKAASPVDSNLQLTHVSQTHERHRLNWCRWSVGVAPGGKSSPDNIFFSVKRQLAERGPGPGRPSPTRRVMAFRSLSPTENEAEAEVELDARLPAELFFCRLFQRHREALCRSARCFAITYPTTFSVREVAQTREAAFRGWLRCMDQRQAEGQLDLDDEGLLRRFPLALDEASAAGYYLLHRVAFEQPHGLARFRYLFPDGLNMLLFDCGGGTIDIGLLRATALPAEPANDQPAGLDVRVIGRSGKRSFGGDNITEAVFKLLKAQMAMAIMHASGEKMQMPDRPEQLARFLEDNAKKFDNALPTTFNPEKVRDTAVERRRGVTQNLWLEAEKLKWALGAGPSARYRHTQQSPLDIHIRRLLRPGGQTTDKVDSRLNSIEVRREQVDQLVGDEVRDSVERCNHLIHEKLTKEGLEVDVVALIGNGARYPLFMEEMQTRLAVPFLEERLLRVKEKDSEGPLELDQADLKDAVAKGVVLALRSMQSAQNVRVQFDRTLSELVPFTLAYKDMQHSQFHPILKEHERYDKLSNASPELDVARRPGSDTEVLLYRHWPGDVNADATERFWPYLLYRFREPVRGGITVRFDRESHAFVLSSGLEEAELVLELIEDVEEDRLWQILASPNPQRELRKIYYAPIQRGEL